jgi:hypothetical protein
MGAKPQARTDQRVTLLRPGAGKQVFDLPPGATLADLLREAKTQAEGQEIVVDGKPLAECVTLEPGMIVTIVPRPRNASDEDAWRQGIGMFRDDPGFEEMMRRVEIERKRDRDDS